MKNSSMCRKLTLVAAVGGLMLSFGAVAGDASGKLQMMDTNKDGKLSASEHSVGARQMFDKMDADKDGKVTATEMDAAHPGKGDHKGSKNMSSAEKIKAIDTDGDGIITAEEHDAGSRAMFARMDSDGDGFVTAAEMQAGHSKLMKDKTP